MISEPDTGQYASEEDDPRRGVDTKRCASKDARPRRGEDWVVPHRLEKGTNVSEDIGLKRRVDCEIPHRLGKKMKHSL